MFLRNAPKTKAFWHPPEPPITRITSHWQAAVCSDCVRCGQQIGTDGGLKVRLLSVSTQAVRVEALRQVALTLMAVSLSSTALARDDNRVIGFDCKDQAASRPDVHFNLDMKKRKWAWENGDVSELQLTDTEARVRSEPFLLSHGLVASQVLNRTTLQYVDFAGRTDGSFVRRTTYQCVMVPAHIFAQNRKF